MSDVTVSSRQNKVEALAKLLDSSIQLPGTNIKIGLDPIIGLIPGVGDAVGALLSSYIIFQAAEIGVSRLVLAKMIGNVAIDTLIGGIPILGDLFDLVWKANRRNVHLLRQAPTVAVPEQGEKRLRSTLLVILTVLIVTLTALSWLILTMIARLVAS